MHLWDQDAQSSDHEVQLCDQDTQLRDQDAKLGDQDAKLSEQDVLLFDKDAQLCDLKISRQFFNFLLILKSNEDMFSLNKLNKASNRDSKWESLTLISSIYKSSVLIAAPWWSTFRHTEWERLWSNFYQKIVTMIESLAS